ncbi:MAG: hypothetical protein LBS96_03520 [Oscillospiraceae bacterium]|jgi:PHD/YefM family antitoxin component YafN of YafNO toxin-antitoxin module|nr:hypothetical protein [Oscillospiraceae bacterium]
MMIRPVSAVNKDFHEISSYCHKHGKPVFLTKEGEGDLVIMSFDRYQAQQELMGLRAKLLEAELQVERGEKLFTMEEIRAQMEEWRKDEEV